MSRKKAQQKSTEAEFQRRTAVSCFNKAWEFLEKKNRNQEDNRQLLLLAHASRHHWGQIGNPGNRAVGDWQISRAYAALKQAELALLFAKSSLQTCEKNNLPELLVSAYEGMARAFAIAEDAKQAKQYLQLARKQLELVEDAEDKKVYAQQIEDTEALL